MKPKASVAIGLIALVAAAGCGGSSSSKNTGEQQVRTAFYKVVTELADRNPAACTRFTKKYALENTGTANYKAALAKCRAHTKQHSLVLPKGLRIVQIKIKGHNATLIASAPHQGSGVFHFVKQSGEWKIGAVTGR